MKFITDFFDILYSYREAFGNGLLVTLKLVSIVWLIGLVIGTVFGIVGARYERVIGRTLRTLGTVLSALPVLVLLFWLHYPFQQMLSVVIDPFVTASVALSTVNVVGAANIVRRTLCDFPQQYFLVAQVCGMKTRAIIRHIQFPLVLRQIIPNLLLLQVNMLQATLFASLISVDEIFRVAQRINALTYRPVEIYSGVALLFIMVCLPLNGLAHWLEGRYTRDISER